jgi:hypothetical protein
MERAYAAFEAGVRTLEEYRERKHELQQEKSQLENTRQRSQQVAELDIEEVTRLIVRGAMAFGRITDPKLQKFVINQMFAEVRFRDDMVVSFKLQAQFAQGKSAVHALVPPKTNSSGYGFRFRRSRDEISADRLEGRIRVLHTRRDRSNASSTVFALARRIRVAPRRTQALLYLSKCPPRREVFRNSRRLQELFQRPGAVPVQVATTPEESASADFRPTLSRTRKVTGSEFAGFFRKHNAVNHVVRTA